MTDIKTSVLYVSGKPAMVTLDYMIDTSEAFTKDECDLIYDEKAISEFRLSYYPYRLQRFKDMLLEAFGTNADHKIYGDFKPLDMIDVPGFYIHLIEKPRYRM